MTKREIKMLLFAIIVFLVVFVLCYVIFTKEEENINSLNSNIIIDGNRFLGYKNLVWSDLKDFHNIEDEEFKVYSSNQYVGDYFVTVTNDKYYFFDSDYNSYDMDSSFLAVSKNSKLSVINYSGSIFNDEDSDIIKKYLKSIDINYNGDYSIKMKYVTNLNNDQVEDYVYILCNELYSDEIFYVVFARIGSKNITINKQISGNNLKRYELMWILNTTNNKYNDIILGESIFEAYNYYLYSYQGKKEYNEILVN